MEIEFFKTENGEQPVKKFLDSLSPKMRAKMLDRIRYLHEIGHMLRPPASKHLDGEIYELRAQAEGNISRVLYFFMLGDKAVLTHGFIKKTQKTPPGEVARSEKYRRQYMQRHQMEE